ncbi:glycoside hydrolase family protein [Jannaschia sp. CCS1]|uniref:glycoside hydrolase family protein n=1 Tax=Jannaschia sp. (strain CCS1) TaxID=290400 RepID=UPI000053DD2A|nr:D-Ala-D-Ala carboxypeptidase family metallohydrolase [Jannaschia sp. CCS1]ABD55238.1 glycoside hydrolase family 24 [Jannaschia sp. CCS1]
MHISHLGLSLIKHFEGQYLTTYIDPVGVATIGYGHTGDHAIPGNTITEAQALEILEEDLSGHVASVRKHTDIAVEQHQFDALVSFAFNVGNLAYFNSTLRRLLNDRDRNGAADQFLRWDKGTVDGRKIVLPGLSRRRKAERHLFNTGEVDFFDGHGVQTVAPDPASPSDTPPEPAPQPTPTPVPRPTPNATSPHQYAADLNATLVAWGVTHFNAAELMEMGASNATPGSPAYGTNALPPRDVWDNMRRTIQMLDRLREVLDQPIHILSGYRSPAYNQLVGGVPNSLHVQFNAIDFYVGGATRPAHWAAVLKDMRVAGEFRGGIGIYSSFVHIDTRGQNADW